MLTITAENIHLLVSNVHVLRGNEEPPSIVAQEVRNVVGSCCTHSTVYIGSAIITGEGRRKDFFACKCCLQLFKDNPHNPVYGKPGEYILNFFRKHGDFPITFNSNAKLLGLQESTIQPQTEHAGAH